MRKSIAVVLTLVLSMTVLSACNSNTGGSGGGVTQKPTFDATSEITVVSREEGSGTRSAFVELFDVRDTGNNDMTTKEAIIADKTDVMMTSVANDPYAIGYISLGSVNNTVKALAVNGVAANTANVKNGTYTIQRPFNIAIKQDNTDVLTLDFIDFIFSSNGQSVVNARGYIAVDEHAAAYAGSKPSGRIVIGGSSSVFPLMERLVEAYLIINPNATIELQMFDSSAGMNGAKDGTFDIGMASRELKESESAVLASYEIAIDGIAVIVNLENPLTTVSPADVKAIFSGQAETWDEIVR
jgi:phosphate transport system substrate-binding protein